MKQFPAAAVLAFLGVAGVPTDVRAQDTLDQVKTLYASAAYEDALSMATRLESAGRKSEYAQYRVFCLVALGRTAEAEGVIVSVVSTDPSFVPEAKDMSPRIRDMFSKTRRALIPGIAHRLYQEARESLDRRNHAEAIGKFETVLALIDTAARERPAGSEEEPLLFELRLLASGFLDLSRATSARAEAAARPAVRPSPPVTPAPPAPPPGITAPTPVKQDLPVWVPPDQGSRRRISRCHPGLDRAGRPCHRRQDDPGDPSCLRSIVDAGGVELAIPARPARRLTGRLREGRRSRVEAALNRRITTSTSPPSGRSQPKRRF